MIVATRIGKAAPYRRHYEPLILKELPKAPLPVYSPHHKNGEYRPVPKSKTHIKPWVDLKLKLDALLPLMALGRTIVYAFRGDTPQVHLSSAVPNPEELFPYTEHTASLIQCNIGAYL
jgi:hypothetical protein